jgi:ATP-dependent DNA ligase
LNLPVPYPFPPAEARTAHEIPVGADWQYEPKWDGFRCLAFRDGQELELQSKAMKPLTRYFPEVAANLRRLEARHFVFDGELVVVSGRLLSFERLLERIHPAASRVRRLSSEHPAALIVFDLLAVGPEGRLSSEPLRARRAALERFAAESLTETPGVLLSPATTDVEQARAWFRGADGIDGVMAKRLDLPYRSGERDGMVKVKRQKTADCVVGGFRYASSGSGVGSLLLGLYASDGLLHHVGFTSSLTAREKAVLQPKLQALAGAPGFTGAAPGGPSRWSTDRSTRWEALRPELVVEVSYDHFSEGRFRHGTKFLRWRPEKLPQQCTFEQVEGRRLWAPLPERTS